MVNKAKAMYANELLKAEGFQRWPDNKVWYADNKNFSITYKDKLVSGRSIVFDSKKKQHIEFIGFERSSGGKTLARIGKILMEALGWYDE